MMGRMAMLWQATRLGGSAESESPSQLRLLTSLSDVAPSIRASSAESSTFGATRLDLRTQIGLASDFDALGPAAKVRRLSEAALDSRLLSRFLDAGSQLNVLQQVRSTLPSVANGVHGYLDFCRLINAGPFPPTSRTLRRWSALFRPGRTFSLYLSHIEKVCALLGMGTEWRTPALAAVVRGLANTMVTTPRFHNILSLTDFSLFMRHGRMASEFGQLGYLAFVFVLRLQPEALPLVRTGPDDSLVSRAPHRHKCRIGIHRFGDDWRLVLKLSPRKNTRRVTVAMRPCFCTAGGFLPRSLCPIRAF